MANFRYVANFRFLTLHKTSIANLGLTILVDNTFVMVLADLLSLEDAHTQDEGEEQFVLLKQGAAHITVNAVGKVFV